MSAKKPKTNIPEFPKKGAAQQNENAGLVWLYVPEEAEEQLESAHLFVDEQRSIGKEGSQNKLIIGENLLALHCLVETHTGEVDLIYIDPPYNTGSGGFRYQDDRQLDQLPDGTAIRKHDPLRHSTWLSFMHRRLEKAKQLMADDATIFLSINEDEYAELRLLCDKVFGRSNYLTTFVVKVRHEDRILKGDKDFHETYEFLLMYRRSSAFNTIKRMQDNRSVAKYVYEINELIESPKTIQMDGKQVEVFLPGHYEVIKGEPSATKYQKINIRGSLKDGNSSGRFHMAHLESRKDEFNVLYKVPGIGDDLSDHRYFLSRENADRANGHYFQGVPQQREEVKEVPYPNLLDFEEAFNKVGFEGGVVFRNGKKPVDFLRFILSIGSRKKDALILDFFAGSGSTGHAVLEQNSVDGGERRFILCTNNENDIADQVTYPRLKNVMEGFDVKRTVKTVLFEMKLSTSNVVANAKILEARERFLISSESAASGGVKEEVRKGVYRIFSETKKGEKMKLGGSLETFRVE